MFRHPDPLDDHRAWEAELERLKEQVPICCECRKPVMEDFCYELNEDKTICAECLDEHHKKETDGEWVCDYCGKAIEDEAYYENDDGEVFHKACVDKHFKREVVIK